MRGRMRSRCGAALYLCERTCLKKPLVSVVCTGGASGSTREVLACEGRDPKADAELGMKRVEASAPMTTLLSWKGEAKADPRLLSMEQGSERRLGNVLKAASQQAALYLLVDWPFTPPLVTATDLAPNGL